MMFSVPSERYEVSPVVVHALKKLLILHADHEQNCSTSTVRLVGSSEVNVFAAIGAGINALWGPLHGGANQKVIEMLDRHRGRRRRRREVRPHGEGPRRPVPLVGVRAPRVQELRPARQDPQGRPATTCSTELGQRDHLLDLALELEAVALNDDYFVERKLYPNVDFYSGLIYRAMGFPTQMFTVLFAIGRLPGWIAHWKEMMESPATKIGRPRQIYMGPTKRPYVPDRGTRLRFGHVRRRCQLGVVVASIPSVAFVAASFRAAFGAVPLRNMRFSRLADGVAHPDVLADHRARRSPGSSGR